MTAQICAKYRTNMKPLCTSISKEHPPEGKRGVLYLCMSKLVHLTCAKPTAQNQAIAMSDLSPNPHSNRKAARLTLMVELHSQRLSAAMIGKLMKISPQYVRRKLVELGFRVRWSDPSAVLVSLPLSLQEKVIQLRKAKPKCKRGL